MENQEHTVTAQESEEALILSEGVLSLFEAYLEQPEASGVTLMLAASHTVIGLVLQQPDPILALDEMFLLTKRTLEHVISERAKEKVKT